MENLQNPQVTVFFHKPTFTCCYLVVDIKTNAAAVIDPTLDFDLYSGKISYDHANSVIEHIKKHGYNLQWILETHVHADHLTGAQVFKEAFPDAITGIGENVKRVQETFKQIFNLGDEFKPDGSHFDRLFKDGDTFRLGSLDVKVIYTPGHTPACVCYVIGDAVFTGDTVFLPGFGTARCDFPNGSASQLYDSIQKIYALPDNTRQYVGHVYGRDAEDQTFRCMTTIGEQKKSNIHVKAGTTKEEFVNLRESRDRTLDVPKLLYASLQVNIRNGKLPPAESNGKSYLKLPLTVTK